MPRENVDRRVVEYLSEVIGSDPKSQGGEDRIVIDLRSVLNSIWRGRWLIAGLGLLLALLAALAVSRMEPEYDASATVMFGIERVSIPELQQLLPTPKFDPTEIENEIQVLRSANLLTRVVQELDLQNDPLFNPVLAAREAEAAPPSGLAALWATLKGALDGAIARARAALADYGLGAAPVPEADVDAEAEAAAAARRQLLGAVEQVQDNLQLTPVAESSVIQIGYGAYSPELAAAIVNAIADQYIVDQLQVKLETANAATTWLTDRVAELRQQVQASEEAVQTLKAQLSTDAGQGIEITQQQLGALNAALSTARGQMASVEARHQRLAEAQAAGADLSPESQLIRQYRDEEGVLLARRATLSENHPAIGQIDAQIGTVRDRIRDEGRRVVAAAEVELETARTQVSELEHGVRALESKALAQSRDEIRIRQLEREAEASRLLYENLLTRLNERAQQEDLQSADARILSSAEIADEPRSNHGLLIVLGAGLFGGALGAGIALLRDNFNNTFRSPRQIEAATGLRVLGALPALPTRARTKDFVTYLLQNPNSALAEAVRNLRTSILRPNGAPPPGVVMVTSSVPGEGKSITSMLIAITSRQMGKSTILVDCDLRRSAVERFFDAREDRPGILSALEGTATLQEAIHEDPATGLHALMVQSNERAKSDRNAADILSSRRFAELLRQLGQTYEVVILDTPPALVVTDARILSAMVDSVVYVVRWNGAARDAVLEGLKELTSVQAPIAGAVLSMVDEDKAARQVIEGYAYRRGQYREYYSG